MRDLLPEPLARASLMYLPWIFDRIIKTLNSFSIMHCEILVLFQYLLHHDALSRKIPLCSILLSLKTLDDLIASRVVCSESDDLLFCRTDESADSVRHSKKFNAWKCDLQLRFIIRSGWG